MFLPENQVVSYSALFDQVRAASPMARLMQTPAEAFGQTVTYVRVCSGGAVFIVAYNELGGMFRRLGDSKTPLLTVFIACVANIAGDLLLDRGARPGGGRAALATVPAQAGSGALSLLLTAQRGLPFAFSRRGICFEPRCIGRIIAFRRPGSPPERASEHLLSGYRRHRQRLAGPRLRRGGAAEKLYGFIMLAPSSFGQPLSAFVAQNTGSGRKDRAKKAMLYGMALSLCCGVVPAWLSFFHGNLLSGLFARDGQVVSAAADCLRAYAIDTDLSPVLLHRLLQRQGEHRFRHDTGHRRSVFGAYPGVVVHEPSGADVPVLGLAGHALLHRGAGHAVSGVLITSARDRREPPSSQSSL